MIFDLAAMFGYFLIAFLWVGVDYVRDRAHGEAS
jgi:hypothetical protein